MQGGISISDEYHNTFGTLGGKVVDRQTGEEMLLSNWHVLVGDWLARPNRNIFQPGSVGWWQLCRYSSTLTREAMAVNLDAAVATLNGRRRLLTTNLSWDRVARCGSGTAWHGSSEIRSQDGGHSWSCHGRRRVRQAPLRRPRACHSQRRDH